MGVRTPTAIERPAVVLVLWIGPVLLALNWLVLSSLSLPHALLAFAIFQLAAVLLLWLSAVGIFVFGAVVAAVQRRDAARWVWLAVGALVGTVPLMVVVAAAAGAIVWIVG